MTGDESTQQMDRRRFLRSAGTVGAGLALAPTVIGAGSQAAGANEHPSLRVALIGAGAQGQILLDAGRRIDGVRFEAVCDIWEAYHLRRGFRILQRCGHPARPYTDVEEMLDKEKNLDAAIVATPDFWHARHTLACLEAGLHVYCEAPMSNTVEDARRMARAARRNGKLLQVGHHRRSNPQYRFCYDTLLRELNLLGPIVAVNGQWNRGPHVPLGWPQKASIDPPMLNKYGYDSMERFRNWRWYKGLGSGPVVDLGAHQLDIYNWFLDARPTSVLATGHISQPNSAGREWCDTVMAVYDYATPHGALTASYQVLSGNRHDGYVEKFLADTGALAISQRSDRTRLYPDWVGGKMDLWVASLKKGYLTVPPEWRLWLERQRVTEEHLTEAFAGLLVMETPDGFDVDRLSCGVPVEMDMPYHQPHLENFFDAIRGKADLTCPAETGYETAVTVLKINEAIAAGRKLGFAPDDFVV
jgi:predicted dehydrogenase